TLPRSPTSTTYTLSLHDALPIYVAWRVEVGESTAAAFACGLVGLMVSRGSSMLLEGIAEFKGLAGKWEGAICLVSGSVAGIMLRSEEHTSELQSLRHLVCRLLLE